MLFIILLLFFIIHFIYVGQVAVLNKVRSRGDLEVLEKEKVTAAAICYRLAQFYKDNGDKKVKSKNKNKQTNKQTNIINNNNNNTKIIDYLFLLV